MKELREIAEFLGSEFGLTDASPPTNVTVDSVAAMIQRWDEVNTKSRAKLIEIKHKAYARIETLQREIGKVTTQALNQAYEAGLGDKEFPEEEEDEDCETGEAEFERLALPLIRLINEKFSPHTQILISCDSAEIMTGEAAIHTQEFLKD